MGTERPIVFECGSEQLVGILHGAASAGRPGVLIVVGGPQYRVGSHRQFVLLARALAAAGYPVFRFDYRGMGDSDGDRRDFEQVNDDVRAAIDTFMRQVPQLPGVVLWGLCDAASAALMYCSCDARVLGAIVANPWVRTEGGEARAYIRTYYFARLLQRAFWSKVFSGRFDLRASVADLFRKARAAGGGGAVAGDAMPGFIGRMRAGLAAFRRPCLFLISGRDLTAAAFTDLVARTPSWQQPMNAPTVEQVSLPEADHTFSRRQDLEAANRESIRWIARVARADAGVPDAAAMQQSWR